MTPNHATRRRRSIRLPAYDYATAGAYFVTICCQNRACFFGEVVDGELRLNAAGQMVQKVWDELPVLYPGIGVDASVLMPNHFHGIVVIGPIEASGSMGRTEAGQTQGSAPTGISLFAVVQRFKSMTTKQYVDGVKRAGWPRFVDRLWQRNYYERVVRDDIELAVMREYVANNPLQWLLDRYHPENLEPADAAS